MSHEGGKYVADVVMLDAAGKPVVILDAVGKPLVFDRPAGWRCSEVVEAAGLIVTDGLKKYRAASKPAEVTAPKPLEPSSRAETPPDDLPAPPPPPPPKPPIVWRLGASVWGDYATVPGVVPALAATAGALHVVLCGP